MNLRRTRQRPAFWLALVLLLPMCGCTNGGGGAGPGHRSQTLALTPQQELDLGRQAYREVLSKPKEYGQVLPADSPEVKRVRGVVRRLVKAVQIEPLQREINLRMKGYRFDWEANVLQNKQVNAFCLPGGKIAVFTGILPVADNDDQLATVLAHEMSHALAHHGSERLARAQKFETAARVIGGAFGGMDEQKRREFMGVLAAGAGLGSKAYDRKQESEADHIGLFLMTFAGYDPEQAVVFWQRMQQVGAKQGRPPEILSDHPSDKRRIHDLEEWVPKAKAAKQAFDEGHIAPARQ
jgi:predicted Zn-dependent protease